MANTLFPFLPSISSAANSALIIASSVASTVALNTLSRFHFEITFQVSSVYLLLYLGDAVLSAKNISPEPLLEIVPVLAIPCVILFATNFNAPGSSGASVATITIIDPSFRFT